MIWAIKFLEHIFKQETIQKSNEKPTISTLGQNYSKVTQRTKTFPFFNHHFKNGLYWNREVVRPSVRYST
jgi:hypothetical protein